jgi:hypothetical protein
MKLKELVDEVIIDTRKLTDYALDLENPKGKDKAVMFQRHLGFTKDNYQLLLNQIYNLVLDADAIPQNEDQFGMGSIPLFLRRLIALIPSPSPSGEGSRIQSPSPSGRGI